MCILKSIHYITVATNIYITIYLHFYNSNMTSSVRITHAGSLHSSYNPENTESIVTTLHFENVKHCPICLKMK